MKIVLIASLAAGLIVTEAAADGLFMGVNWSGAAPIAAQRSLSERTEGVIAARVMVPSPHIQFGGHRYAGPAVFDGICDAYQPNSWQAEGVAAGVNTGYSPFVLYTPAGNCASVVYPGFSFFFAQPNVALAPHYAGGPLTDQQRAFPESGYGTDFWGNTRH